jgi:hypothetical protein
VSGPGMVAETSMIIAGYLLILGAFWAFWVGLKRHIDLKYEILSQELAQAIMKVAESAAMIDIEPPNPMQQMVMGLIQDRIAQNRGANGQFIENME